MNGKETINHKQNIIYRNNGDKKYKGIASITGPMPLHFPAVASGHQYSNRRISCGCCVRRPVRING